MRHFSFNLAFGAGIMALAGVFAQACNDSDGDASNGGGGNAAGDGGGGTATNSGGGGAATNSGGAEPCGPGTELCGEACTVTTFDPDNCGQCGNACGALEVCSEGACASVCPAETTQCGRSCLDTSADPENCGQCGNACAGADACVEGQCVAQVPPKGVYTMTNDVAGNKILAFTRAPDGSLSPEGTFTATGGTGTGGGLGNQNGLIFDQALGRFFAVNAGDSTVSMLGLRLDGTLELLEHIDSGGVRPVSVTVHGDVLYVVNAGMADSAAANIAGFKIVGDALMPIAGSSKPLSAANPGPAQIQFSPDGKVLVVTERMTNMIDTFAVTNDVPSEPIVHASAGQTPFGFDFSAGGQLIVSEAVGGQPGLSSASSYTVGLDGLLTTVSGAVPTTRTAACWLVVAGEHAYVANAQTSDVTGFKIGVDGALSLLNADGVTGQTTMGATDEDVTDDEDFLYVVNNGAHVFSIFQIGAGGSLTKKPDFVGIPSNVSGLVAR